MHVLFPQSRYGLLFWVNGIATAQNYEEGGLRNKSEALICDVYINSVNFHDWAAPVLLDTGTEPDKGFDGMQKQLHDDYAELRNSDMQR